MPNHVNLEKEIEEERLEKQKERQKKIALVMLAVVLGVLFVVGLNYFDFSSTKVAQETKIQAAVKMDQPVQLEDNVDIDVNVAREAFKEALKNFEEKIEPELALSNLDIWAKEEKFKIEDSKRQAIGEYSGAAYAKALQHLSVATKMGETVLNKRDQIFNDQLAQAFSAYQADDYKNAKLHISNAREVKPTAQNAVDMEQKIDDLPHILQKINEAETAKIENDLVKEHRILSEVSAMAPQRQDVAVRLLELAQLIKEKSFSRHISQGLEALQKGHLKTAKSNLQLARKISPKKEEVLLLSQQIMVVEKNRRVEHALKMARSAVAKDDWLTAQNAFLKAQKDVANDQEVVSGLEKSRAILSLKAKIKSYLNKPYRLSNANVLKSTKQTLGNTEQYVDDSPSLTELGDRLYNLLKVMNKSVSVKVQSDGLTFVQVRGVGKVGLIQEKTIQLKPGNYTFEGLRKGYKSTLIKVQIPYDKPAPTIKVICDEPA